MQVELRRQPSTAVCTLGRLYVDGAFQCYTLEPPTPIDPGIYPITITRSTRFSDEATEKAGHPVDVLLPLVNHVPGHTGIRIHAGNTAVNTKDCILVGETQGDNAVLNSVAALEKLQALIQSALTASEDVWLTVDAAA